jgi:lipid A 3-O-deacylase
MKIALLASVFTFIVSIVNAQGIALTTGVLDYSDRKKRSEFFEANYSFSENKSLETIIGKIVPMTGAMLTKDNASMIYAGIKTEYKIGNFFISPSFAPGYYNEGDGKDLGHDIEFKPS